MSALPDPGVRFDPANTALVVTDPQNDFLSPEGVTWELVGASVTENNTVANIAALMQAAKINGYDMFVSPRETIITSPHRDQALSAEPRAYVTFHGMARPMSKDGLNAARHPQWDPRFIENRERRAPGRIELMSTKSPEEQVHAESHP